MSFDLNFPTIFSHFDAIFRFNQMDKEASAPQLHFDVLLNIAEKLVFSPDNDFRQDLRDPPNSDIVNFMFAGPACRWAFFSQFRRLTKLCVNSAELQLYAPKPIQGIRGAVSNNKEFFQGPFVVHGKFFYELFSHGVLCPSIVDTFFVFGNGKKAPLAPGEQESPAESFARLFLFNDCPEKLNNVKQELADCELNLELLKLHDDTTIYRQFNRVLNLNAESVQLEISTELSNVITEPLELPDCVTADRTTKLVLSYTIDVLEPERECSNDFPVARFSQLLRHVARACPALRTCAVSIFLQGEFSDDDFKHLSAWLHRALKALLAESDELLAVGGNACSVTVSFRIFFPESTLKEADKTGHVLAKMGEQLRPDEADGGDNDGIDMDDLPDTYTISRKLQLREEKPEIRVVYSLVGLEDETIADNWNGFHGQMPVHMGAGAVAGNAPQLFDFAALDVLLASADPVDYNGG